VCSGASGYGASVADLAGASLNSEGVSGNTGSFSQPATLAVFIDASCCVTLSVGDQREAGIKDGCRRLEMAALAWPEPAAAGIGLAWRPSPCPAA